MTRISYYPTSNCYGSNFLCLPSQLGGSRTNISTTLRTNAQLNVLSDGLKTEYYNNGILRPSPQPLFYPSTKVSLVVNKQRATAQYYDIIRFHINGTKHKLFLQSSRPGWNTDRVWSSIDMDEGLRIALKKLSKPCQHKHCKMMHGWWNMGHQRVKITPESQL
jgi:hypothetical protein